MQTACQSPSGVPVAAVAAPARQSQIPDVVVPATFGVLARFTLQLENQDHTAPKRFAGSLDWSYAAPNQQQLLLTGPFGQGLAAVAVTPEGAVLRLRNGQVVRAETAAALLRQHLGYPLPLEALRDWLFGQGQGAQAQRQYDAAGRTRQLRDQGWVIDYRYPDVPDTATTATLSTNPSLRRPVHLILRREGELELQLHIESWQD